MNHLCGLPNLKNNKNDGGGGGGGGGGGDDSSSSSSSLPIQLADDEIKVLDDFRRRYQSALRLDYGYKSSGDVIIGDDDDDGDDDSDEKKKEELSPSSSSSTLMLPAYEISHDKLPPSGLRPLDDVTLWRYLLADRSHGSGGVGAFDPEASYRRLIAALQFRKERKCDIIVHNIASCTIPPSVHKYQRLRVGIWAGYDRHHRPVVFERLGEFFASGNAMKATEEQWMESYLYFLEMHFAKMRESASRNTGTNVDRIVYFADFKGVVSSIMNRKIWKVVPLLKALVKSVECHYPEIVDHITLFNVPRIASAAYRAVRGFLDPVTADKIEIFAGVPYDRLRELVPDHVIPIEYGGKNEIDYPKTAS